MDEYDEAYGPRMSGDRGDGYVSNGQAARLRAAVIEAAVEQDEDDLLEELLVDRDDC